MTSYKNVDSRMVTILLVDDHEAIREGYRGALERGGWAEVVGEASTGEEGYRLEGELSPDVVIMDLSLPGINGIEAIRRIRARRPECRILVVSMQEKPLFVEAAMQAGASGYVTKASGLETMREAVKKVVAGEVYLGPDVAQRLAVKNLGAEKTPLRDLSPREFETFRLLATGVSSSEIAERMHLSSKTVSNHITQLKAKLKVASTAQIVHLAIRYGVIDA